MARTVLHNDDRGYVVVEGNEITIGSKLNDPPKVRLAVPISATGGGGGAISFNSARSSDICFGDRQNEMAMLRVEQAEDVRGQTGNLKAEFNFLANDGSGTNDSAMKKPLAFVFSAITRVADGIRAAFGGGNGSRLVSPNGRFFAQIQDDGNFVLYDNASGAPVPYWWTGGR